MTSLIEYGESILMEALSYQAKIWSTSSQLVSSWDIIALQV